MEKISGILGTSPRIKSAEVQNAPPIRPGAPSFGQPIGEVTLAQRKDLSTAQKANILREQMLEDKKRLKEKQDIEDLSAKFFMNKMDGKYDVSLSPEELSSIELKAPVVEQSAEGEIPLGELTQEDMKFMPKGYYLDRSA